MGFYINLLYYYFFANISKIKKSQMSTMIIQYITKKSNTNKFSFDNNSHNKFFPVFQVNMWF